MASVVDQNIYPGNLLFERFPECPIRLIANEYFDPISSVGLTFFPNIHSVHSTSWTEVRLPHLQAAPTVDTDLEHVYFPAYEFREVFMIDVHVMFEFPN